VASGSEELTEDNVVIVVVTVMVAGLVGIGVEGVTGSSSPGMIMDVPFPGTLLVELAIVVVDRLAPVPPFVFRLEVLEAGGSVTLVRDVRELVLVDRLLSLAPMVT